MPTTDQQLSGGEAKLQEYIERLQNATSPEEKEKILSNAGAFRADLETLMEYGTPAISEVRQEEPVADQLITPEQKGREQEFFLVRDVEMLKAALADLVPVQYHNLIDYPEILEDIWVDTLRTNNTENARVKVLRAHAFSMMHLLKTETARDAQEDLTKQKIHNLEQHLKGLKPTVEGPVSTKELEPDVFHRINRSTDGIEGIFWNADKQQDAVAVIEKTVVVADGAGSYERSGVVSRLLSHGLAEQASTAGSFDDFKNIFEKENIENLLTTISKNDEYTGFTTKKAFSRKEEGLCTFVVTKESADGTAIEYASLGDSPLIVLDRDEQGRVIGFEIINDSMNGEPITQDNFYTAETISYMNNPETHLIGIRKDARLETQSLSTLAVGKIEKKQGRSVIVASDALIKMMINAPRAFAAIAMSKDRQVIRDAFEQKGEQEKEGYIGLWDEQGGFDFDTFTRAPQHEKDADLLLEDLVQWKQRNHMFTDDVTVVTIDASPKQS